MSASIPIPSCGAARPVSSEPCLGASLPARSRHTFHMPRHGPTPLPLTSQDDLTTSWPPRPSVELVSRSARKWLSGHTADVAGGVSGGRFEPWDFSEVASATDEVRSAFELGSARAERPPREGVCGTYFIRGGKGKDSVLCVFKPIDEEAGDIDMSPQMYTESGTSAPCFEGSEFSLGPSHGINDVESSDSSVANSPNFSETPDCGNGFSIDSDRTSHMYRSSGFHAGEGAYKEVAAYLLDHERFAKVPQTALAKCQFSSDLPERNKSPNGTSRTPSGSPIATSPNGLYSHHNGDERSDESSEADDDSHLRTKMGAFQVYVENQGDADDYGPGVFDKAQVHRIAVLDIRTLNHDRHGGNILVTNAADPSSKSRYNLIPIDHGYILPERIYAVPWPVWMDWPMVREEMSDRVKNYIACLDAEAEARILHDELDGMLRPGSLRSLKVSTLLLQKGTAAGLTLYDIGLLMYTRRDHPCIKSELRKIMDEAEDAGLARERHLEEEAVGVFSFECASGKAHNDVSPRRMASMSVGRHEHENYIDDYIVKYAGRRIDDVVRRVAENKLRRNSTARGSSSQPLLGRARSIPDFGIGFRPISAMLGRVAPLVLEDVDYVSPTPLSSPVDKRSASSAESLHASMREASRRAGAAGSLSAPHPPRLPPIQIPINDASIRRIAIPVPRPSATFVPGHTVGSASTCSSSDSTGSIAVPPRDSVINMALSGGAGSGVGTIGKNYERPPLFQETSDRKPSPVSPLDACCWETGSS